MRHPRTRTWPHEPCHHPRLGPVGLPHPGRLGATLGLALTLLLASIPGVRAEAPALAIALTELELRVGPGDHYPVLAIIPAGAETVLTGLAEDGYVQITSGQDTGWALAAHLDAGHRLGGIRLALATVDVAMRTEPSPAGSVRQIVPAGGCLIVTGAVVGEYTAASYNGLGGWVESAALDVLDPATP
jgi:uncharacterized protein YraI